MGETRERHSLLQMAFGIGFRLNTTSCDIVSIRLRVFISLNTYVRRDKSKCKVRQILRVLIAFVELIFLFIIM